MRMLLPRGEARTGRAAAAGRPAALVNRPVSIMGERRLALALDEGEGGERG